MQYRQEGMPLIVLAGKEYGTGSSRDWAAKGPLLLGVTRRHRRIVRAHPPQQPGGHGRPAAGVPARRERRSLGLTGRETYDILGIDDTIQPHQTLTVRARSDADSESEKTFTVTARLDTPVEVDYYKHGGILPYVVRSLVAKS